MNPHLFVEPQESRSFFSKLEEAVAKPHPSEKEELSMKRRRGAITFLRALIAICAAIFVLCLLVSCESIEGSGASINGSIQYRIPETGTLTSIDYSNGQGSASVRHPILDPETGEVIAWAGVSKAFGEPPVIPEK